MSNNHSKAKYRPSLPAHLIAHITDLAKNEIPISQESIEVIGILAPFQAKVENLAIAPAYITTPKMSKFESLGGEVADASIPKEEYWKQCYQLWVSNPNDCNLREIAAAREHMYLHNLMAPEEIEEFEKGIALIQPQAD